MQHKPLDHLLLMFHMILLLPLINPSLFSSLNAYNAINQNDSSVQFQAAWSERVPALLHTYRIPGVAIGVVEDGRILPLQCFGYANKQAKISISEDSIFQLASISKTFTAWGILRLVEEGKIGLEIPVITYLSGTNFQISSSDFNKIFVKMLMDHTSGLAPESYSGHPSLEDMPSLIESLNGTKNYHDKVVALYPPGQTFFYSGGNYSLLQLIIENVTGSPFKDYMKKHIFIPLQLFSTTFDPLSFSMDRVSTPYGIFGQPLTPHFFTEQAAAGLYSTVSDAATFIVANLKVYQSRTEFRGLLRRSTVIKMMHDNENHYGLGYETETLKGGHPLAYHFGANLGWRSGFFILPEMNSGLVILTNSDNGRYLVEELAADWITWKTDTQPNFYHESQVSRYIMEFVLAILLGGLFLLTIAHIKGLGMRSHRSNVLYLFSWAVFIILWVYIFFSPYIHPKGWVIGSFMPVGFFNWTKIICLFCGVNILVSISWIFFKRIQAVNKHSL